MNRKKITSFGEIAEQLVALANGEGREAEAAQRLLRHVEDEHFEHSLPVPDIVNEYIWERRKLRVAQYRDWRTIEDIPEHLIEWAQKGAKISRSAAWEILDLIGRRLERGLDLPPQFAEFLAKAIRAALESDSPSLDRELGLKRRRGRPVRLLLSDEKDRLAVTLIAQHIAKGKSVREASVLAAEELDPENGNDASENYRKLYRNFGAMVCTKPLEKWTPEDATQNWPLRILRMLQDQASTRTLQEDRERSTSVE